MTRPGRSSAVRLHGIAALVIGAAALIALTVLLAPGTATAAGTANPDAGYYVSTVTAIEPAVPGLEVVVHGGGESVTLTNRTGERVVVLGYSGEPYLQIDDDGVLVNTNSPTAALNADGGRSGVPPDLSGPPKPAKWRPAGEGASFTWSDFRSQWSAEARPPIVAADPHAHHQVFAWAIQLTVGSQPTLVRGTVSWTGIPGWSRATLLILAGAAVLVLLLILALAIGRRRARQRRRRMVPLVRSVERSIPTDAR